MINVLRKHREKYDFLRLQSDVISSVQTLPLHNVAADVQIYLDELFLDHAFRTNSGVDKEYAIDGIKFRMRNGTTSGSVKNVGGRGVVRQGQLLHILHLQKNEYIVEIKQRYGNFLDSIVIKTNLGREVRYGGYGGKHDEIISADMVSANGPHGNYRNQPLQMIGLRAAAGYRISSPITSTVPFTTVDSEREEL